MIRFLILIIIIALSGCDQKNENANDISTLILISMDGFRWDYVDRTDTPHFDYLIENGVKAEALIPVYPTYTFPNHLSIVTGQYPENHGIISNTMWDTVYNEWYYIGEGSDPVQDGKWYEAEPIWNTVEKHGKKSAIYHWPGSEAEILGSRPSTYFVYENSSTNTMKTEQVLSWLDQSEPERPSFIATYFNDANYYGHRSDVESSSMDTVIQGLDDDLGLLLSGLDELNILDKVHIMIVSDHGMVNYHEDKVIFLDDHINFNWLYRYHLGPAPMFFPYPDYMDSVYLSLKDAHPNLAIYEKEEIPEDLHYSNHRRIYPIVGILDEGWLLTTHPYFEEDGFGGDYIASHGYHPQYDSMQGICIAFGPAFKKGVSVPKIENIHLVELMAKVLDVDPVENNGSLNESSDWFKDIW